MISTGRCDTGRLLQTNFRFLITEVGGCAIDVDTDEEFDVVRERYEEWRDAQAKRAEAKVGPLPLPAHAREGEG